MTKKYSRSFIVHRSHIHQRHIRVVLGIDICNVSHEGKLDYGSINKLSVIRATLSQYNPRIARKDFNGLHILTRRNFIAFDRVFC